MHEPYIWQEMRRDQFPILAEKGALVVVPTGSTEQHGIHCPVGTDIANSFNIALDVSRASEDFPVIVAPPVWSGLSPHHKMFPGIISLRMETYGLFLRDVCTSIAQGGFEHILLVNGHGGNRGMLHAVCVELSAELEIHVAAVTYWMLIHDVLSEITGKKETAIGHAGVLETSVQLYVQEHLVDTSRLEVAPGISDDPSVATKEKGKKIYDAAVEGILSYIPEWRAGDKLLPPRVPV